MGKTLIIVESPAKGKKIQSYLGKDYIVLSSKGHITELAKGGRFGIGVDIANNFKPHYVLMDDKIATLQQLIDASKTVDQVYIASDPDREGEAIAWHLKERLDGIDKPIKRMTFGEITKKEINKSVNNVREIDMNLFHAQEARRILDRIVGFTASPFLMNFFGPKLSAGRVQSVVTKIVIDREREIEIFVPEEFWTIQVALSKDNEEGFITKYSQRITDADYASEMRKKLSSEEYVISEVLADEEKRGPFPPLVTTSLQRTMSRLYDFAADRTMKAAQSLYELGYCSYIRTDSVRVSDEAVAEVRDWLTNNNLGVPKKSNLYKNKDSVQDAHECIRPSDLSLLPDNSEISSLDEKLVYAEIWKHFVASQMTPAVYNTLRVTAHVKGDEETEVKATGKALKSKGYLEILGLNDDSKIEIPNLVEGDVVKLFGKNPVKMEKKQTQPPPRFSEDKLIKELENRKIGRPATIAELLSKICARNYVEKKGNVFHATDLGKKITDVLSEYFTFMDYDYTADMEKLLDEIGQGKVNHIDMLKKFYPEFKSEIDRAYLNHGGTLCDKCSSPMALRSAKNSGEKFLACSAYPKCKNTKSI
jgi:DNA topoisomerase I